MKKMTVLSGLVVCAGIQLVGTPIEKNNFQAEHPLAEYSLEEVRAGKIPGKRRDYLRKYVADQLCVADDAVIESVNKKTKRGDFGIPAKLPSDPKLLKFLDKSADHFRVSYAHLGKTADRNNLRFTYIAGALRDLWIYHGDENARKKYVLILKHALRNVNKMSDKELRNKIDESGTQNLWHPLMKSAAFYYAELYEATGDEQYAKRACLILERFGEVIDKWKIRYWKGAKHGEYTLNRTPDADKAHYGSWGWWGNVHDLKNSTDLLHAYALIKSSKTFSALPQAEKKLIVNDLLHTIVKKHLYYPFTPMHNQNMNRIIGMIDFGKYLDTPAYTKQAMTWFQDVINLAYRRDGFWGEGSISYGFVITRDLLKAYAQLQKTKNMSRDELSRNKNISYNMEMIKEALNKLALPDGRSIALEDSTWDKRMQFFGNPPVKAVPFLMGASGIGMMGFGNDNKQVRLYLHWDDSAGHDHPDMLNITLWACNQEISSETAYRGLHEWNRSTAAHNTVLINEKNQPCLKSYRTRKEANEKLYLHPQYTYRSLWRGYRSRYDDGGILQLWDTTETDVQVAEVEGSPAFAVKDGISKYNRTLVLIKTDEKSFCILDIFRVEGGTKHDWMLHGDLSKNYSVKVFDGDGKVLEMKNDSGTIGKYLKKKSIADWTGNAVLEFDMKNNNFLRTTICGASGTKIVLAEGPAIRLNKEPACWGRPGYSSIKDRSKFTSDFVAIRRKGPKNVFVAVHEAYSSASAVKKVELSRNADGKTLDIKIITSTQNYHLRSEEGIISVSCKSGTRVFGDKKLTGKVLAVSSINSGDKENSFTVSGDLRGKVGKGELILIIDGDGRRHAYTIKNIVPAGDNKSRVLTVGETGMQINNDLMVMTYFPSWDIQGELTYLIPGKRKE